MIGNIRNTGSQRVQSNQSTAVEQQRSATLSRIDELLKALPAGKYFAVANGKDIDSSQVGAALARGTMGVKLYKDDGKKGWTARNDTIERTRLTKNDTQVAEFRFLFVPDTSERARLSLNELSAFENSLKTHLAQR
jgi:hypothetical protein